MPYDRRKRLGYMTLASVLTEAEWLTVGFFDWNGKDLRWMFFARQGKGKPGFRFIEETP